jgi:hypothetical protein
VTEEMSQTAPRVFAARGWLRRSMDLLVERPAAGGYILYVSLFARHFGKSLELLGPE